MRVRQVDPRDETALAAWFAVQQAVERDERPDEVCTLLPEVLASVLEGSGPDPDSASVLLSALCRSADGHEGEGDDEVVGAVRLHLPRRDNLHLAEVELYVHPAARGRGVGRALVIEMERVARADGRTSLLGYTDEPPGRPSAMTQGAGKGLGFVRAQEEVRRDIDLPLDPGRAAALEDEITPYAVAYDVVTWRDVAPEHLVDDLAVLHQRMSTDVPLADLDITEEVFDGARVRRHEQLAQAMGRALYGAGAVHRDSGRLVAYTDQAVPLSEPTRAYQWNTIVLSEHRGHRLGTLVKLACLRRLAGEHPATRVITTWNAEENVAMIRVNDALGARVNGTSTAWQKRL